MIKDEHLMTYRYTTALTESDLFDTTDNLIQQGDDGPRRRQRRPHEQRHGWYITLGAGEKVDGPATTLSGATFFGTNTPADGDTTVASETSERPGLCHQLPFRGAVIHLDGNVGDPLNLDDRSQVIPGGGYPPAPVALQVDVDGQPYQGVAFGPTDLSTVRCGLRAPLPPVVVSGHRQLTGSTLGFCDSSSAASRTCR